MASDKKESKTNCNHNYIVTGWNTKGGHQNATSMRCTHCLKPVSLEELESKEWRDAQGF